MLAVKHQYPILSLNRMTDICQGFLYCPMRLQPTNKGIAAGTQQGTYFTCRMVMIDNVLDANVLITHGTKITLRHKHLPDIFSC